MAQDVGQRIGERFGRKVQAIEQAADAIGAVGRRHAQLGADPDRRAEPIRDRLAVEEPAEAGCRLDGMSERVPEIEGDPSTARVTLALVGEDDLDPCSARALDKLGEDA